MKKILAISVLLLIIVYANAQSNNSNEQTLPNNSKSKKAVAIIQNSIKAMDPFQKVPALNSIYVSWIGTRDWGPILSPNIDLPNKLTFAANKAYIDFKNYKSIKESSWQYHGEDPEIMKDIYNKNNYLWTYVRGENVGDYKEDKYPFDNDFYAVANHYFFPTYLSHLLTDKSIKLSLDDMLTNKPGGFFVIKVTEESGLFYHLYIDSLSLFLQRIERLKQDPLYGTVILREQFYNYKRIDSLYLPTKRMQTVANRVIYQQEAAYSFNETLPDEAFEIPENFVKSDIGESIEPTLEKISKGIYMAKIRYNINMVFVEFNDYFIAFYAPWNSSTTKKGLILFSETIKDKPIKYVGLTGHWWDMSGGIREFIVRDVEIISTSKDIPYYTQMANADYTLSSDSLSLHSKKAQFKSINKKEVISDGKRKLEIIYIPEVEGENPYIFYYLPNEQILISNSGFEAAFTKGTRAASDRTAAMVEILKKKNLKVKTLFQVNGGVATWDQLMSSINLRNNE